MVALVSLLRGSTERHILTLQVDMDKHQVHEEESKVWRHMFCEMDLARGGWFVLRD